jgi:hypothetical protein
MLNFLRYFITAGLAIQLMGCIVLAKYNVSEADKIPKVYREGCVPAGHIAAVGNFQELCLFIEAQNRVATGFSAAGIFLPIIPIWGHEGFDILAENKENPNGLPIWLAFSPADTTFSFDPGRVILKYNDGTSVKTKNFMGPGHLTGRPVQMGCKESRNDAELRILRKEDIMIPQGPVSIPFSKDRSVRFSLYHSACFILWFETDSSPNRDFVLSIEGIEKNGEKYSVPEITFKKGSIWGVVVMP